MKQAVGFGGELEYLVESTMKYDASDATLIGLTKGCIFSSKG